MTNEHTSTEAPRLYGELYYSADSVAALLRSVAQLLEGDQRYAVLRLSSDLPTTMRWPSDSGDGEQPTGEHALYRSILMWLRNDPVLGPVSIRLTCLLRRGSSNQRPLNREHPARMANQQLDPLR